MRRPAPLPASADEPEEAGDRPAAPARRTAAARERVAPRRPVHETSVESADPAHPTVPIDEALPPRVTVPAAEASAGPARAGSTAGAGADAVAGPAAAAQDLRSIDVWRAARARRKALRAEIRRFTQRSRRRRLVWWGSLGAVVALIVGSVVAAYSPLFAVEKITVAGTSTLDPASVEKALDEQLGAPLALVDASEVKAALVAFPIIESYALEARPPHELLVRIVERTPVGVIRSDAGYSLVDAAGVVLATTEQVPQGQPVLKISGGTGSSAFHSAGLVVRSLPADLRTALVEVHASSADDVTLALQGGRTVVWGSADDSPKKAAALVKVMAAAPDARSFDVSSPSVAVVR
ncbi:FtsQ-type POTRA domain-containing protein [Microbacterium sp.]|uniref:FtsQ-type POTRA domain-containing protein n=1 Tax=Microbacterium sp. TaxID=51671 RepID=UPI0028118C6F|nr:FtsQ-type POTRA domain-containing protein [Microbacterium sp.]